MKLYENKMPSVLGVLDPRLGTNDQTKSCITCKKNFMDCTGHYGYIKLNLPLFHIGFFKKIINILQAICKNCSRILISDEKINKYMQSGSKPVELAKKIVRFKKIIEECKKAKECAHCHLKAGKVKKMLGFSTKI